MIIIDNGQKYIDALEQLVYRCIAENINENTIDQIVNANLKLHIEDNALTGFQKYYFEILDNEQHYSQTADFFRKFKKQYSLQYIDNDFLDKLESSKYKILEDIKTGNLIQLYFSTFYKAKIKYGSGFIEKNLGSFFTKLVHTFRPNDYCALDNPIKKYFGLEREGFFISILVISMAYKRWATDNKQLVETIKDKFKQIDKNEVLQHNRITDLKLLDLIFWSKANRP